MGNAFSTLYAFCFSWFTVYLLLRFLYTVWAVTDHLNRVISFEFRPRRAGGAFGAALESALKLMGWGSAVALPTGIVAFMVASFQ